MLRMHVARGCGPTGRTLAGLLAEAGVAVTERNPRAHVCWGLSAQAGTAPVLNARCNRFDKMEQLAELSTHGILTVPMSANIPTAFPALARQRSHHGGRDIVVCLQPEDAQRARTNGRADYFTTYIPRQREFRVWIYRRRHLGTYEKILRYPARFRGVGCNYDNGFAFGLVTEQNIPRAAVDLASRAVDALGLDFGAVDILLGKDNRYYVLEVNTAPGVEGEGRQVIQALAAKIAAWVRLGFPRRNGDTEQPGRARSRA